MDQFDLDLNKSINSGLFIHKVSSNDSLDFLDNNEFINFEKENQEDNFTENFNKVFPQISPDNKEDSFSEKENYLNINNVEDFIIYFQNKLSKYYFQKNFDGITRQIEKKFPFFFNEKNIDLIYMIEKLKFFKLLGDNKIDEAKNFYEEKLLVLIKEIKKQNWQKKSKFFTSLIKKPCLIGKQDDFLKKYYDQFAYELEKAIRTFLHEENDDIYENENKNDNLINSNNNINIFSSSSIEFGYISKLNQNQEKNHDKYIKNKENIDEKEMDGMFGKNNNINNINNEGNDELDLENRSTKEEFSDFEDELQPKICAENGEENNNNIEKNCNYINSSSLNNDNKEFMNLDPVNNNNAFMNFNLSSFSKSYKCSYEKKDIIEEENEFIIDTSSKKNKDKLNEDNYNYENYKYYNISTNKKNKETSNKSNKKTKNKEQETIFNQLPFLNSFKPKYIKRETIDKKIIRTFKNYILKENKEKRLDINNINMDQNFFINFINGNLLPPIDFYDGVTGEYIKFNSFNCNYLLWFFSKKGVKDIYMQFINEKGKEFINNISEYYEISQEEKNQLNSYIINYPFIFDISIVNNITQGTSFTHIYRTVDKNKKIQNNKRKKKDKKLELKRNKSNSSWIDGGRERSRSRDFEHDDF